MKGLAHIGALEVLQEKNYLRNVREYIGISAGAFCAFCICIGCSLSELRTVVTMLDFGLMRHIEPEILFQFPDTFGLDDGANMDKLLVAILKSKKLSPDITFAELAVVSKMSLRVFATDLNTCMTQEFSALKTPSTMVRIGLRASMAIPIYFTPVKDLSGHLFVDGGVISHQPFYMLSNKERETTLCIAFTNTHKVKANPITDIFSYMLQMLYSVHNHQLEGLIKEWRSHIVLLPCGDVSSTNFEATADQKIAIMDAGRQGMETFLAGRFGSIPPRRFSVV